jgi:large conductance mechanosensitive channel
MQLLKTTPNWVIEFRAFLMRGNLLDMAVGIIIGLAFGAIVNSLVKDIFNPLIGVVIGGVDFSNVFVAFNGHYYDSLDAAQKAGAPTLNIGLFINSLINFLIIASAAFWIVRAVSRHMPKPEPMVQEPTQTEILLKEIRDRLPRPQPKPPIQYRR